MPKPPKPTASSALPSKLASPQTVVVRVIGRGELGAVCVIGRPLSDDAEAGTNRLVLEWDGGATGTVPLERTDSWDAPIATLCAVAERAADMQLDIVRFENWVAASVEFNVYRDDVPDVCTVSVVRAPMRVTWRWLGRPDFCAQLALPMGAEALDCLSGLAVLIDGVASEERSRSQVN